MAVVGVRGIVAATVTVVARIKIDVTDVNR